MFRKFVGMLLIYTWFLYGSGIVVARKEKYTAQHKLPHILKRILFFGAYMHKYTMHNIFSQSATIILFILSIILVKFNIVNDIEFASRCVTIYTLLLAFLQLIFSVLFDLNKRNNQSR